MRAILPEFEGAWDKFKSSPMGWTRDRPVLEPLLHLFVPRFEEFTILKGPGLVGSPGAQLRIPRARSEISIRDVVWDTLHSAFDAHLAPERFPVEEESCRRVLIELPALLTFLVRIENEAVASVAFEKDHAHARIASVIGRCGRHGFGIVDLPPARLCEHLIQQCN